MLECIHEQILSGLRKRLPESSDEAKVEQINQKFEQEIRAAGNVPLLLRLISLKTKLI